MDAEDNDDQKIITDNSNHNKHIDKKENRNIDGEIQNKNIIDDKETSDKKDDVGGKNFVHVEGTDHIIKDHHNVAAEVTKIGPNVEELLFGETEDLEEFNFERGDGKEYIINAVNVLVGNTETDDIKGGNMQLRGTKELLLLVGVIK